MTSTDQITPTRSNTIVNWISGGESDILEQIHQPAVNIAIHERDIAAFSTDIQILLQEDFSFKCTGVLDHIIRELSDVLMPLKCDRILEDVVQLCQSFEEISQSSQLRVLLATVKTNMCIKSKDECFTGMLRDTEHFCSSTIHWIDCK